MPCALALDPSLQETGFAVLDTATGRLLAHGVIPTRHRSPLQTRLATIAAAVLDLIHQHAPTDLAIERPFVGRNRTTALTLGAVRGLLLYLAEREGLAVYEYTTSQIKTAITSNPTASKLQVQNMLARLTHFTGRNTNESDAIAVGLTHLRYRRAPLLRPRRAQGTRGVPPLPRRTMRQRLPPDSSWHTR
jgi:crossover junction endodeoxyribonuclease RuvC